MADGQNLTVGIHYPVENDLPFSLCSFNKEQVPFKLLLPQSCYFVKQTPETMLPRQLQSWSLSYLKPSHNMHFLLHPTLSYNNRIQ